ncbi:hypothetical protein SH1V18_38510 [Vallitalea longa]|uniref:Uncharacterized protein n=1 Tax=Vallitalea longa TaxID=2936439 RepID=A0A9W5YET9_9FIRM|nr:hypothetical protein [Vallitalea longa]GKX31371.1 hypothetical protein SH1V18_38510 [Vallitalea longa]
MSKKVIVFVLIISIIIMPMNVYADDNADSGSGDTKTSTKDRGFYRYSEYMYKVSVYVGLSDKSNKYSSLESDFKMIGNNPIYIKPSNFNLPNNLMRSLGGKVDYLTGSKLTNSRLTKDIIIDNPPPIPITNGGNINKVKSYFGDTETLNALIDSFARQKGTTPEGLVSNINFTIGGITKKYPSNQVLPIKDSGQYQNQVPWVIIYEPVIISYLKDHKTILGFTATEYALAQKLKYFNFKFGNTGQYISAMTHSDLPNSIILEESWFGYPVVSALPDGVYWDEDRIISSGGWGMRMLKADHKDKKENNTSYDNEYRVDTDVITSVKIYANTDRITPDDKAYIKFNANGKIKTTSVTMPSGSNQLVFIKWHTPSKPQDVKITVEVTGNSSAKIDRNTRYKTINAKVVNLESKEPPNPTANDRKSKDYTIPRLPNKSQNTSASWGEWKCHWKENWVEVTHYRTEHYTMYHRGGCKKDGTCPGHRRTRRVPYTVLEDHGDWEYDYESYSVSLSGAMTVSPDIKVPTAKGKQLKSGYGININVSTNINLNAPKSHVTGVQNVLTFYPEFNYQEYLRLMEKTSNCNFELKKNKYSTYNNRVHFTPVWFPNSNYRVYGQIIDLWTPDGMLSMNVNDYVNIQGNLYDDWHIGIQ